MQNRCKFKREPTILWFTCVMRITLLQHSFWAANIPATTISEFIKNHCKTVQYTCFHVNTFKY